MVVAGQDCAFRSLSVPRLLALAGGSWQGSAPASPTAQSLPSLKISANCSSSRDWAWNQCQGSLWCSFSWRIVWGELVGKGLWGSPHPLTSAWLGAALLCSLFRAVLWTLCRISSDFKWILGVCFHPSCGFRVSPHVSSPRLLWMFRNFLNYKKLQLKLI